MEDLFLHYPESLYTIYLKYFMFEMIFIKKSYSNPLPTVMTQFIKGLKNTIDFFCKK